MRNVYTREDNKTTIKEYIKYATQTHSQARSRGMLFLQCLNPFPIRLRLISRERKIHQEIGLALFALQGSTVEPFRSCSANIPVEKALNI